MTVTDNWKTYFTEQEALKITDEMIKNQQKKLQEKDIMNQRKETAYA